MSAPLLYGAQQRLGDTRNGAAQRANANVAGWVVFCDFIASFKSVGARLCHAGLEVGRSGADNKQLSPARKASSVRFQLVFSAFLFTLFLFLLPPRWMNSPIYFCLHASLSCDHPQSEEEAVDERKEEVMEGHAGENRTDGHEAYMNKNR